MPERGCHGSRVERAAGLCRDPLPYEFELRHSARTESLPGLNSSREIRE